MEGGGEGASGVVHQDVQASSVFQGPVNQARGVFRVLEVGGYQNGFGAPGAHAEGRGLCPVMDVSL